jgi:hypothetical protein
LSFASSSFCFFCCERPEKKVKSNTGKKMSSGKSMPIDPPGEDPLGPGWAGGTAVTGAGASSPRPGAGGTA